MTQYLYKALSVIVGCSLLFACNDDYTELDKGHDVLTLTSSSPEIILQEQNFSDNAIELSWTTGTNYGTGYRISYTLEITGSGKTYSEELGTGVYSWSKSVEELNELLRTNLGANNNSVDLEARILATVVGVEETEKQNSTVNLKVTTYQPVTPTLYLTGDATPSGWSAENASEMTRTQPGVFTWTGKLSNAGGFKFITTLGEFLPSYNRDATAGNDFKLIYRSRETDPDNVFSVSKDTTYTIKADLLNLTLTLNESKEDGWRFEDIYFVGSFTGWGFVTMKPDPLQMNLFHYGNVFDWNDGGEFKFGTQQDWYDMFFASYENAPYTSTEVIYNSTNDNKWALKQDECGKGYKIALSITPGAEKMIMREFIPYETIYLVGDASPSGWDLENATPMNTTGDPYIFTWTGSLSSGELKISCDKHSDWNGAWFMSYKGEEEPTGEIQQMLFVDKSDNEFAERYPDVGLGDVDRKWKISSAGTYTITVDQLRETISIVKQ